MQQQATTYLTATDRARAAGTITLDFRTRVDGILFRIAGETSELTLSIHNDRLMLLTRGPGQESLLDLEDTGPLSGHTWHSGAVTVDETGTRVYLDGYQAFAGTATLFLAELTDAELQVGEPDGPQVRELQIHPVLTDRQVLARATPPAPQIQFAANSLSDYDTRGLAEQRDGTLVLRFRVRGRGQGGALLAASGAGQEQLRLELDADGIRYRVLGREGEWRDFAATGDWADGAWHEVGLRVGLGAVEIYVDGYREVHVPGQAYFADVQGLDRIVIGQDTKGVRLWGEVQQAALYDTLLNDFQLKRLSQVSPVTTRALFDRGYHGSVSYRIPSLISTPDGTVVAGADQRTTIANDSPNHINFVIRRSIDSGQNWQEMQTVITSAGAGEGGASVIDSCPVVDAETGRILVVIDHFPGRIGQPNNEHGVGVDDQGRFILRDREGQAYTWQSDGTVRAEDDRPSGHRVEDSGELSFEGRVIGNVFLPADTDHPRALHTDPTSYLQLVWSDDDGATWQGPRNLNHQVKEPWMAFLGTAPGTGIQLRHGRYAGRLMVPVYFSGQQKKQVTCAAIISDDHGETWRLGGTPNDNRVVNGQIVDPATFADDDASLHECTIVERRDGSVLMLMRNQHPSGRVLRSVSADGGESWGPVQKVPELPEIFCQPNAIAWPSEQHPDRVVFANAAQMLPYRGSGVLRLSYDGGETWPVSRTLNPGHHVYQSMTVLPDGSLGVLWENEIQGLYLTTLPETWFD